MDFDFLEIPMAQSSDIQLLASGTPLRAEEKLQMAMAWRPLADFISKLPCLKDLVYGCAHQIPLCVLEALHQHSPKTRLHMLTFELRSLYFPVYDSIWQIDYDEYVLTTSPSLYSLAALYINVRRGGIGFDFGYTRDAVFKMMAGRAPNLAKVALSSSNYPNRLDHIYQTERLALRSGFYRRGLDTLPTSKGHIRTFTSCGDWAISRGPENWTTCLRLDELVNLSLACQCLADAELLVQAAKDVTFKSICSLKLWLHLAHFERWAIMDHLAATFLSLLPPLRILDVGGCIAWDSFSSVLDHHAESLESLILMPSLSKDSAERPIPFSGQQITDLAAKCQRLVRLKTLVARFQGDAQEVAMYHALGNSPRLKHITLHFDWYIVPEPEELETSATVRPVAPSFRTALINGAVDADLAREIFRTMQSGGSALETLELHAQCPAESLYHDDMAVCRILQGISRSWACQLDQGGEDVTIRILKNGIELVGTTYGKSIPRDDLAAVWDELWPSSTQNRAQGWKSFPLLSDIGQRQP
ncbi:hypothetical protein FZEAL_4882 [Fusarium zealandicum]|uniref:Uncharacterized protein n=1 Tax=Fusarium zealandicum TaxID=1053134 RepID=A0A8H4UKV2_9HYPO|nr:hypothetical protein FZEAL_4882 [Fusarium zealandicum]